MGGTESKAKENPRDRDQDRRVGRITDTNSNIIILPNNKVVFLGFETFKHRRPTTHG